MLLHIRSFSDLITSRAAIHDGFFKQALAKTKKANPYLIEAQSLALTLETIADVDVLLKTSTLETKNRLYAAIGFSDKAKQKMIPRELEAALGQTLETIQAEAHQNWRTERVYRYLLTRGDTLGGEMRNLTGAEGGRSFTAAVTEALRRQQWSPLTITAPKNAEKIVSIEWRDRLLVFDKKPIFIGNNLNVILLDKNKMAAGTVSLEKPESFLACGELNGGIDPAGADEHWKTAQSALSRVRDKLKHLNLPISLFFVGAAIEVKMAKQIFAQFQTKQLTYAANLSSDEQTADLADWLTDL